MRRMLITLFLIGFLGACTRKTNNYDFNGAEQVRIDESQVVLTTFPSQLEAINDSVVAMINSRQTLSMYHLYSGKNLANFSVNNVNFDSLIQHTFQKKYEGQRNYLYDKDHVSNLVEKVGAFQLIEDDFYIYVSTQAEIEYLNDSTELMRIYDEKKIKQLLKSGKKLKIKNFRFVQFLFVTDVKFNLKKIIPLYDRDVITKNNYSPFYERAFFVEDEKVHVFLFPNGEAYETRNSPKKINSFYTAVIDLNDETKTQLLLNNKHIDYSGFSFDDYLGESTKLDNRTGQLLFFNGKEMCKVKSGEKLFSREYLKPNEWISNYYINDNNEIIMVNYTKEAKKHPTEFETVYSIDSVHSYVIKVFDLESSQWLNEKKLPSGFRFPVLVTENKIIYLTKDKQHYYFNYMPYNED